MTKYNPTMAFARPLPSSVSTSGPTRDKQPLIIWRHWSSWKIRAGGEGALTQGICWTQAKTYRNQLPFTIASPPWTMGAINSPNIQIKTPRDQLGTLVFAINFESSWVYSVLQFSSHKKCIKYFFLGGATFLGVRTHRFQHTETTAESDLL